jgi:DHA2 family multidrug resistance protein
MLVIAILFFFLFLAWERGEEHPVVDFSLFRYRNFVVGSFLISIVYLTLVLATVIYPIWMQGFMGYTATWSGIVMSPMGLAPILLMPLIGSQVRNWDPRPTVAFGVCIWAAALYMQALTSTDTTDSYMATARFILGVAMPFAWMPLMVVTLVGLPPEKIASATGLFNFSRMLASSMGTAVGMTLWDQRSIYHRSRLAETLSAESPQYQEAMNVLSRNLPEPASALAALDHAVGVQARTLALDDIFYICVGLSLLVVVAAWALPSRTEAR